MASGNTLMPPAIDDDELEHSRQEMVEEDRNEEAERESRRSPAVHNIPAELYKKAWNRLIADWQLPHFQCLTHAALNTSVIVLRPSLIHTAQHANSRIQRDRVQDT